MTKRLLFSVTIADCDVDTFCTGGNGGQHRNAKKNGVRVTHRASGATAEHRDGREQHINKRLAFVKMVNTPAFKAWHKAEVARRTGAAAAAEAAVEASLSPERVRVECFEGGRWVVAP